MKYLIVGLGNIGSDYHNTRHNVGFSVINHLNKQEEIASETVKYGSRSSFKFKSRTFILLQPNTYVNKSGTAVNYWLQKEKISTKNLLIILDDLSLPFGKIRLRSMGSDGGHNGLKDINSCLGDNQYARLRFGIGSDFQKGKQSDYVLGNWTDSENEEMPKKIEHCIQVIKSFGTIGVDRTMSTFNNL